MQMDINELTFKISTNLLHEYINCKLPELRLRSESFDRDSLSRQDSELPLWLINYTKDTLPVLQNIFYGTKQYTGELSISPIYDFYHQFFIHISDLCNKLCSCLQVRLNGSVEHFHKRIYQPQIEGVVGITQNQEDLSEEDELRRLNWNTNQKLESLSYFLNSFTIEEDQSLREFKAACDKLLLQKHNIQNLRPSLAVQQIQESASMIEQALANSEKVFQEAYAVQQMEFKNRIDQMQQPQLIADIFKEEMGVAAKQKFKEGVMKTVVDLTRAIERYKQRRRVGAETQTDVIPQVNNNEKLQKMLTSERKNNEMNRREIRKLTEKLSKQSMEEQLIQKLQKQQALRQSLQQQYRRLQQLYHQKCQQIRKQKTQHINQLSASMFRPKKVNVNVQTNSCRTKQQDTQTDSNFYYHYQQTKINDYKGEVKDLQHVINQKDQELQEMDAVRTFRDNYKTRRDIFSTVIKSSKKDLPKSLRYLQQAEVYDVVELERRQREKEMDSIHSRKDKTSIDKMASAYSSYDAEEEAFRILAERRSKKKVKVTLEDDKYDDPSYFLERKKSKKMIEQQSVKGYFQMDQKIQSQRKITSIHSKKDQVTMNKISIKSILKSGAVNQKQKKHANAGTQTDEIKNLPCKCKHRPSIDTQNLYSNESITNKVLVDTMRKSDSGVSLRSLRHSKLSARGSSSMLQAQNLRFDGVLEKPGTSQSNDLLSIINSDSNERSLAVTPQQDNIKRRAKKDTKVLTQPNQVLHVNNSLNLSLFDNNLKKGAPFANTSVTNQKAMIRVTKADVKSGKIRKRLV